jgi:hypothetical protein
MNGVAIVRAALVANANVTSLVGTRIYAGIVPQGTAMPALGITEISRVENPTVNNAQAASTLVTGRIQVTVLASDYAGKEALLDRVRRACNYTRGMLAGLSVARIARDIVGPDMEDTDLGLHMKTIDFKVQYYEPNT